jgi:hypothetical protein
MSPEGGTRRFPVSALKGAFSSIQFGAQRSRAGLEQLPPLRGLPSFAEIRGKNYRLARCNSR